jgi:hypothetical protein
MRPCIITSSGDIRLLRKKDTPQTAISIVRFMEFKEDILLTTMLVIKILIEGRIDCIGTIKIIHNIIDFDVFHTKFKLFRYKFK